MRHDLFEFVKAALKKPLEVTTIFPTSPALAERMIDLVDLKQGGPVSEVGCGTGAITKYILPKLQAPEQYTGIELSTDMVDYLKVHFSTLRFEQGPAEMLPEITGPSTQRAVISSLPWSMFPTSLQKRTLSGIHSALVEGGLFVTYVCLNAAWLPQAHHFSGMLSGMFDSVDKSPIEWRNIPPAFVYVCRK